MKTFSELPEDCGFTWCSDKCLLVWIVAHNFSENGELVTAITDNKTGEEFNVNNLKPEDMDIIKITQ